MPKLKKGQRRANRMTKKVGEEFVQRYLGNIPAGWEVVREFPGGRVLRRVYDPKKGGEDARG